MKLPSLDKFKDLDRSEKWEVVEHYLKLIAEKFSAEEPKAKKKKRG